MAYPPAFQMPTKGCGSKEAKVIGEEDGGDGTSMSSGNWGEDFPPLGVTNLEGGVYCLSGNVLVESGTVLHGSSVVLVIEHGFVRFSGGAEIQLSAPRQGDREGLLIYMPMENHNKLVLNGNINSNFSGAILAPGAEVIIAGNENRQQGYHSQIIGYTIEVGGQDLIVVKYQDEQNYDAFRMPEVRLTQ